MLTETPTQETDKKTRKKWRYSSREMAENIASEVSSERDKLNVALNAALSNSIQWLPKRYGNKTENYKFGIIPRFGGALSVITFHCGSTGQSPSTVVYDSQRLQIEIDHTQFGSVDDELLRSYRDGLYDCRCAVNDADKSM